MGLDPEAFAALEAWLTKRHALGINGHSPVFCTLKGDENKIRGAGCDDYIAKPISVPVFLETVKKHLP